MTFRRHQAVLRALERLYAWTNVTTSRNLHNYFPHLHGGNPDLRVLRADLKAEAHPSPDETTVVDLSPSFRVFLLRVLVLSGVYLL